MMTRPVSKKYVHDRLHDPAKGLLSGSINGHLGYKWIGWVTKSAILKF